MSRDVYIVSRCIASQADSLACRDVGDANANPKVALPGPRNNLKSFS
jgi:hypothetical protein